MNVNKRYCAKACNRLQMMKHEYLCFDRQYVSKESKKILIKFFVKV